MMARKMRDSGVEWIGEIPEGWEVLPLGNCFDERNEKVSDYEWEPLSVTKQGIVKQLDTAAKSDAHDARKKVCKNDFVINSRSDRKQSCGVSLYDGSVSLINIVLSSRFLNTEYVKYLLKNYGFAEEFYRWGTGIVADLWSTKYERMKKIMLPIPDADEQQKIADFLDGKVGEIDSVIAKTKETIEDYKKYKQTIITDTVTKGLNSDIEMKESGIEWIGKIPNNWDCMKLRHVVEKIGDIDHYMPETQLEGVPYIMTGDLQDLTSEIDFEKCKKVSYKDFQELSNKIQANYGDVILARYATIGTVSYVDISKEFLVSYSCVIIKPTRFLKGKLLFYYAKTSSFIEELKKYTNSNTQGNVGIDSLYQVKIILPSIEDQEDIIAYLDEKCSEIDKLIAKKEELLADLESYKRSLIYEYVTGKKEAVGKNISLENLFMGILVDYFITYDVKPFSVNVSLADDVWDEYTKLRSDHAEREAELAEFQRSCCGTMVPPKEFDGIFTILLKKNYIIDSIQKNSADWIGTLIHETVHVNDFIQFAKLVNITDYDILLDRNNYRMFHLWSEFNAKTKGYYYIRKDTYKNVKDENQLQYIFETELSFLVESMSNNYNSTDDGDRKMYYVVHFIGELYALQKLLPEYFVDAEIKEFFGTNEWMYELYNFLITHTKLENVYKDFEDMKEILKQNFSGLD